MHVIHLMKKRLRPAILMLLMFIIAGCAAKGNIYRDENMDFGSIRTVAVMPFGNLARDNQAPERVRDVFSTMLMASGSIYVVPPGEVARGIARAGITNPAAPSPEEVVKLAAIIKVDAIMTGVIREYGEVRSGSSGANVISLGMSMLEAQTGKVVWTASSTKGGIGFNDRLLGGGGQPMNAITEQAVNDILDKLFN